MTILTRGIRQLLTKVATHIKADAVVQGTYWDADKKRGCFIGCLTHSSDPRPAYERFELTGPIMRLVNHIFENLPGDEAQAFFAAFPDAVGQDGRDLSLVHWQFLASELRTLPRTTDTVNSVVDRTIEGMDLLAAGKQWPDAAVWAAGAAGCAAYMAPRSINMASQSAIRRQRDLLLQLVKDAPMGDV